MLLVNLEKEDLQSIIYYKDFKQSYNGNDEWIEDSVLALTIIISSHKNVHKRKEYTWYQE